MSTESGYRNFLYDDENQLTSVDMSGNYWKHEFQYDGRGRLRKVTDYTWSWPNWVSVGETRYIYAGMRVLQERNSGNTPTVSYVRGQDLSGSLEGAGGIGGLLARSSGYSSGSWTTHHFYHSDGNGNVVNLTDANAGVVATYRYDPFGRSTYSAGTLASANVYRFSSKQWIPDINVYYYGYRFYDPNLQRWLNRDPKGEAGFRTIASRPGVPSEGDGNLYGFIENTPTTSIDPFGLITWDGCDEDTRKSIGDGLSERCKEASNNNCFACILPQYQMTLREFCRNPGSGDLKVKCRKRKPGTEYCAETTAKGVVTVYIPQTKECKDMGMGCVMIHEIAHAIADVGGDMFDTKSMKKVQPFDNRAYRLMECAGCTVNIPPGATSP